MANPDLFRLRVVFSKGGRCAMLSHLEIARALERAVRRAGLPYAISQGFSPHMKIAFGAALPVGVGGTEEIFDVQLTRWVDPDDALVALKRASVEDLMVSACAYIGPRDAAASVAYPVSVYEAVFSQPLSSCELPESFTVVRKKKEKTLLLADYLVGAVELVDDSDEACASGEEGPKSECADGMRSGEDKGAESRSAAGEDSGRRVRFTLRSLLTGSLRPDLVVAELAKANPGVEVQTVTRVEQRAC